MSTRKKATAGEAVALGSNVPFFDEVKPNAVKDFNQQNMVILISHCHEMNG